MAGWITHLFAGDICHSHADQGELPSDPGVSQVSIYYKCLQAVQHVEPGRAALIKSTEIITSYILVASLTSLHSLDWMDSVGVVLIFLAVAAATVEDKLVNRERWRWF